MPIKDLSDTLIHIWDAINHLSPVSTVRKLLYWLLRTETTGISEVGAAAENVPYPALWGSTTPDPAHDIKWGGGVWS
jgi:hypothetical protein